MGEYCKASSTDNGLDELCEGPFERWVWPWGCPFMTTWTADCQFGSMIAGIDYLRTEVKGRDLEKRKRERLPKVMAIIRMKETAWLQ